MSGIKALEELRRPPLKAKDGQPIEEGTLLYGEDGRAWLVESIEHGEKYPVEGSCDGERKRLKAEWLVHEKPRTLEDVVYEIALGSVEVVRVIDGTPVLGIDREQLAEGLEFHADEIRAMLGEVDHD